MGLESKDNITLGPLQREADRGESVPDYTEPPDDGGQPGD